MERRFETPGTPTIEVRLPAGRVELSTHEGNETIVQLEALRDNAASHKAVEHARVELRKSGGGDLVLVDVRERSSFLTFSMGAEVGVRVQAPPGSNLKTSLASANLVGHGTFGSLDQTWRRETSLSMTSPATPRCAPRVVTYASSVLVAPSPLTPLREMSRSAASMVRRRRGLPQAT